MNTRKIIFISGWGSNSNIWKPIVEKIDNPMSFVPWEECLDDENNLLHRTLSHESQPAILVGWSLGGMIALSAAIGLPEKVAALVVISSSARMTTDNEYEGTDKRLLKAMKLRLKTDKTGTLKDFASAANYPNHDNYNSMNYFKTAIDIDTSKLSMGLSYLVKKDVRKQLCRISQPANIIHGKCDKIMIPSNAQYLRKNIPHSTLKLVADSGHFLVQNHPELIYENILNLSKIINHKKPRNRK